MSFTRPACRTLGKSMWAVGMFFVTTANVDARSGPTPTPAISAPFGKVWLNTYNENFNTGENLSTKWNYELGNNGGWGNGESQSYTSSSNNAFIRTDATAASTADPSDASYTANSVLNIRAIGTTSGSNTTWTSARMTTSNKFSQAYGLFEFRAKMPNSAAVNGLWPALWMMPQTSKYGSWPESGEIDVMECKASGTVGSTIHAGAQPNQDSYVTRDYAFPSGQSAAGWHTYDVLWQRPAGGGKSFTFYVDGIQVGTSITGGLPLPDSDPTNLNAPFDQPFYLIMNLAIGGSYTGYTIPPAGSYDMEVDYVRAFLPTGYVPDPSTAWLAPLILPAISRRR
jgi:beta-glucanase (GH16 family)